MGHAVSPDARRREAITEWSPHAAFALCAFYLYALLWLTAWVAIPALVLGWQPALITSDSMGPAIRSGDIVLLGEPRNDRLVPGTVVTFTDPGKPDHLITHRINDTLPDGTLITKGDGNTSVDSTQIDPETVQGIPRILASTVGMPLHWYNQGKYPHVLAWLLVTVGAVHYVVEYLRKNRPADTDEPDDTGDAPSRLSLLERSGLRRVALLAAFIMVGSLPTPTSSAAFVDPTANTGNAFAASEWEAILGLVGGVGHTCGVNDEGVVWCWGLNDKGQLGDGTTADRLGPTAVPSLSGVDAVGAGLKHTCAVKSDGTVRCWGYNNKGQLGNTTTTDSSTPVQVTGLTGATAVAGGEGHTCALKSDGTVRCWGLNDKGQLGNTTTTDSSTPVQVSGLTGAVAITAGVKHSCAVKSDGTVRCWGYNNKGQLGNTTVIDSLTPVQVSGLTGAAASIAAGEGHTCATKSDGTVHCWGLNDKGQLGNTTTIDSLTPVQVTGLTGATSTVAGLKHSCATNSDATVHCWGYNNKGQLGNGTTTDSSTPVQVVGPGGVGTLSNITVAGAGDTHTCAADSAHSVYCWGLNNAGQLGDTTKTDSPTPVQANGT